MFGLTVMNKRELNRLDYRQNLIVDPDNPILVQKAWRDRFSSRSHWNAGYGGEAYLSRKNSEDALTWNVFRSLQKISPKGFKVIEDVFGLSTVTHLLFWSCDVETSSDIQQILSCLIREIDGRHGGTMTEPDLVIITEGEVAFVECKLNRNGNQSPWKAQGPGATKRLNTYINECGFPELITIKNWEDVYQLVRQYVYSKSLCKMLGKRPLVFPLIHESHLDFWADFYNSLREFDSGIFCPFITWQQLRNRIQGLASVGLLVNKMNEALHSTST